MTKKQRFDQLKADLDAFWGAPLPMPDVNPSLASYLIAKEEESGAIFEPEEESLPARLEVATSAAFCSYIVPQGGLFTGESQRRRSLEQAVYRHNAWPELKGISGRLGRVAWGDDEDLGMIREALDAILDGKERP